MEETPKALRVAVVEDDPRIQQLISAEITDEGHACICFGSAEDFLDEAGSDRFDLLLLDLMLPGMDGLACSSSMAMPYPPARPLLKTCPERAASTGVPSGAAKSRPACISQLPRIGCRRQPNPLLLKASPATGKSS